MYIRKWEKKWNESDKYVEKINGRKIYFGMDENLFTLPTGVLSKILSADKAFYLKSLLSTDRPFSCITYHQCG